MAPDFGVETARVKNQAPARTLRGRPPRCLRVPPQAEAHRHTPISVQRGRRVSSWASTSGKATPIGESRKNSSASAFRPRARSPA